jgi:uncharacterized protein (TIGR04255 family)
MTKANLADSHSFLPNAPLIEVVFELRWKLQGDLGTPAPFWIDPGYPILAGNFTIAAEKYGFKIAKKMSQDTIMLPAHSIGMRFYRTEDRPFPLWQIGPGIFASNESAAYTWPDFKKLTVDGVKAALSSYPKIKEFGIKPIHMELRYVDSFDSTFITHQDPLKFINENSSLKIDLPSFFKKGSIGKSPNANLLFEFPISNLKNSTFIVRIANAMVKDRKSILLESKVIAKADPINFGKTQASQLKFISNWLEDAHSFTSPFFKEFVAPSLIEQFKRSPNVSA